MSDHCLILQEGRQGDLIGQFGRRHADPDRGDGSVRAESDWIHRCESLACFPGSIIYLEAAADSGTKGLESLPLARSPRD